MRVLIYGGGRLGQQVVRVIGSHFPEHELLGVIDDVQPAGLEIIPGVDVIGSLDDIATTSDHDAAHTAIIPAIGYTDQTARGRALDRARGYGYRFLTLVHPQAWVEPSATLGEGVIALAGTLVDQGAQVGDFCYLDQGVKIGEDTTLVGNAYLAAGAILCGGVTVGRDTFVGAGAVITDGVIVGDGCVVNAQSLVHRDLPAFHKLIQTRDELRLPMAAAPSPEVVHGQA